MDFDPYTPCPGGKNKKVRFCCRDLLKDLDKLWRMIEGQQFRAALQHIDRLRAQPEFADRACLLAIRSELLCELEQADEAQANAEQFVEKHPDSPVAWAEMAVVHVSRQEMRPAVDAVQEALEHSQAEIGPRVLTAMHQTAQLLYYEGQAYAARSLWMVCAQIAMQQGIAEAPRMFMANVRVADQALMPLLIKTGFTWRECPEDAPWKARFDEASAPLGRHCWRLGARQLAELTEEVSDSPVIWHNLAALRVGTADVDGAIQALRRQADCEESLEDAVEAEAMAMLLEDDPLGDALEEYEITWNVREPDPVHEALLSDPQVRMVPVSEDMRPEDGSTPPKLAAMLLNRPVPEAADEPDLDNLASVSGYLLLFGRQTDRAARLVLYGVRSNELDQVVELIRRLGGENLEPDFERESTGKLPGVVVQLETRWVSPRDMAPEQMDRFVEEHRRRVLFERWPQTPLPFLDGRSPQEAAADPNCRRKLLAAILLLDQWLQPKAGPFDFNPLRTQLGLPVLEPIEPSPGQVKTLPVLRLARVETKNLSNEDLAAAYNRVRLVHSPWLISRFARAIVERPEFGDPVAEVTARMHLAKDAESYAEATRLLDEAAETAKRLEVSVGEIDMLRLHLALKFRDAGEVLRLIDYIRREHGDDPETMQELFRTLVQLGLIRPDGSMPPPPAESPDASPEQAHAAGAAKIWTPDGDEGGPAPGGASGGIWTPE